MLIQVDTEVFAGEVTGAAEPSFVVAGGGGVVVGGGEIDPLRSIEVFE